MSYVLDTNAFRVLEAYYPRRFPSFWESFNGAVTDGHVLSVREVLKELHQQSRSAHILEWIETNKTIFRPPEEAEMDFVAAIFRVPHFQALVGQKQILEGLPVADPFVIARAKVTASVVVTEEKLKPNAAKIPNVCEHFDVDCTNLEGLMDRMGWRF